MIVDSGAPKIRLVEEYDITFTNGMVMPMKVDKSSGDTIDFDTVPGAIRIVLAKKASTLNPGTIIPEEDITIFHKNILVIQHRTQAIQELSAEQRKEMHETVRAMAGGTIH